MNKKYTYTLFYTEYLELVSCKVLIAEAQVRLPHQILNLSSN